jgi:hypothetical protein
MLTLSRLLATFDYAADPRRAKLVRHKDSRYDLESLLRTPWFEVYQQYQGKPIFDGCSDIIVFLGEEKGLSRFVGIYGVGQSRSAAEAPLSPECPHPEWARPGTYFYPLTKRLGFETLENRLVIDWGKGALAWHQWFSDRTVVEIRPAGRALPPFRDYLRVHLTFDDLQRLAAQPDAHRDWVAGLSAVGAVYLIVDSISGEQYVGSATGPEGLWQRWREYAKSGHGGNLRLKDLCGLNAGHPKAFTFSILDTFSRTLSRDEALSLESFFKQKLGTRAFGLNAN